MEKPPFQFGLKAIFLAATASTFLLATVSTMAGKATAFGVFCATITVSAVAAIGLGLGVFVFLLLVSAIATTMLKLFEGRSRSIQFRIADIVLTAAAVFLIGASVFLLASIG